MTINSDDPPMFGTSLNREYEIAADLLDLDEAGVAELSRTAVRVSYAPADVKDRILEEIDSLRGTTARWRALTRQTSHGQVKGPGSSYLPGPPSLYDGPESAPRSDTLSS